MHVHVLDNLGSWYIILFSMHVCVLLVDDIIIVSSFHSSNEWHSDTVCTVLANSLIKLSHMIDPPVYRNDLLDDIAIVIMEIYADNNNGGGLWKPTAEKILLEVLDGMPM